MFKSSHPQTTGMYIFKLSNDLYIQLRIFHKRPLQKSPIYKARPAMIRPNRPAPAIVARSTGAALPEAEELLPEAVWDAVPDPEPDREPEPVAEAEEAPRKLVREQIQKSNRIVQTRTESGGSRGGTSCASGTGRRRQKVGADAAGLARGIRLGLLLGTVALNTLASALSGCVCLKLRWAWN